MELGELPSAKAERKTKEAREREEEKKAREQQLRRDLAMTFKTAHGLRVLKFLMNECGFGSPILGANPASGEIDEKRTVYAAMRLNLYIKIRKLLPFSILKEVEYEEE